MKLFALATLALLVPDSGVRFEKDGVRVGDALVQGRVLELKGAGAGALLASGSTIEALASSLEVQLAPGRTLTLEPGIRVLRVEDGYRLTAHLNRRIRFTAAGETLAALSPTGVIATEEGWVLGDRKIEGASLRAAVETQDEDSNLDKMLRAKERVSQSGVPKLSTRTARLYWGNPLTGGQAADSINVRLIPQVSPSGAP